MGALQIDLDTILAGAWRRDPEWHGEAQWRCVVATGLGLADDISSCDRELIYLFGLLHDTRRENEHVDPGHGMRGGAYARELAAAGALALGAGRLELLCAAITLHSNGLVSDEPTTAACWDADRLHLPRFGIDPNPDLFSTAYTHGSDRLATAAHLRASPPGWDELLRRV